VLLVVTRLPPAFSSNPVVTGEETILSVKVHYHTAGTTSLSQTAGDYTATLTSVAGCDSIATLHLVVNPVVTGEENITICEAHYHTAGITSLSQTAGDYTATLTSVAGCDSIATLHLVLIQW
jgi:hypothetical protein